jgi:hypothetical protein
MIHDSPLFLGRSRIGRKDLSQEDFQEILQGGMKAKGKNVEPTES